MSDSFLDSKDYEHFLDGLSKHISRKEQIAYGLVTHALLEWAPQKFSKQLTVDELKDFVAFFMSWVVLADKKMNQIDDFDKKDRNNL